MTCIVGLVDGGTVHIGGDSAGISGWTLALRADPKVFRNGPFLIGFTSSFRMGQLLAHAFTPPPRAIDQDIYAYMVTSFVSAVRDCLKAGGFAERHSEAEKGGDFLVGYRGRLFLVEADYQVGEEVGGMAACGCGREVALGALFAAASLPPRERIKIALEAAERFNAGVRGPFRIESMP